MTVDEPEEDAGPIEDLDADLDEEVESADDLADLIAQTLAEAEAEPEDFDVEPSVSPLDDDSHIEVLDDPTEVEPAPTTSAPPAGPTAPDAPAVPAAPEAPPKAPSTEQELYGALDLGPLSNPDVRDRLLAQALAHSEMQDARYRVPYADTRRVRPWKGALAALLLLVAAVLALAPPGWVRPEPPAQLSDVGRARSLRAALLLQAQQVDAYRVRFQRLPDSLDELTSGLPGVRFVKSGTRAYQLIGYERDGNAIIYDSSNPGPEFARLTPSWTPEGAP